MLLGLALAGAATGHKTGLMGYGQSWYDPPCAYACRTVIGYAPLDCPDMDHDATHGDTHMHGGSPMAPCAAQNVDFLATLAYCLGLRCAADGVSPARLEAYWADQASGDPAVPARWTYGAVLANITQPPTRTFQAGDTLNYTALIADDDYRYQYDFDRFFDWEEAVQSTYVSVGQCTTSPLSMDIKADNSVPAVSSSSRSAWRHPSCCLSSPISLSCILPLTDSSRPLFTPQHSVGTAPVHCPTCSATHRRWGKVSG